jgi:3-methylcrotonyl-CoA carboxylase alpha subunit
MRLKGAGHVHHVARKADGAFDVDGVRVDASVAPGGTARFDGLNGERKRSVFVARDGDHVFAQVDGRSYRLTVVSRAAVASEDDSEARGDLEAPMPGRVTRVAVALGDVVTRGQELIVVEAMKMENALVAPCDGVVKSLAVKVGDMVAPGPALVVVEAAP